MSTEIDVQQTITDRLNNKLKEALIDLIPPEVLRQKSDEAAKYFLNGRTNFGTGYNAEDARRNYRIEEDPNTLVGMLYVEMKKQAAQAIKEAFDSNPAFKPAYDAAAQEAVQAAFEEVIVKNAGSIFMDIVGMQMQQHMYRFQNDFMNNLRSRGINV